MASSLIADVLWPVANVSDQRSSIQVVVSRLRTVIRPLGAEITFHGSSYRLVLGSDLQVDLVQFRDAATQARKALADRLLERALQLATDGLDLWTGRPLQELDESDIARGVVLGLDEQRSVLLETMAEAKLGLGQAEEVVVLLSEYLDEHPYRENVVRLQMLALYQCGRQTDALNCFAELRTRLIEDLGLEPGPRLRQLELELLQQHPLLDRPKEWPSTSLDETFVGRETEEASLANALAVGRHVAIVGQAGSGKSTLVQRFHGLPTGRCHELAGTPPLWPWPQVLADVEACLARGGHPVDRVRHAREVIEDEQVNGVFAVSLAVVDALASAAHATKGVVVEDIQWAQPSAKQLLTFVMSELVGGPAIVTTSRMRETSDRGVGETIELGPLSRVAIAELLRQRLGLPVADRLIDQVIAQTGGVALLVDRAVHAAASGVEFELIEREDVLEEWLGELGPIERRVLEVAGLIGEHFDSGLLIDAFSRTISSEEPEQPRTPPHTRDVVLGVLDHCVQRGLVQCVEGAFLFRHALLRISIVDAVPPGQRAKTHYQIATALIERADAHYRSSEIATQLANSLLVAPPAMVMEYALRAATEARGLGAHGEAMEYLTAAVTAAQVLHLDTEERLRLELTAAEVTWLAGDNAAARDRFAAAADLLDDDDVRLADIAASYAGFGLAKVEIDERGFALLERALRGNQAVATEGARLRCRTRQVIGSWDDATIAQASENLFLEAQTFGDPETSTWALGALLVASMTMDGVDERLRRSLELVTLGQEIGSDAAIGLGLAHQADALAESGDFQALTGVLGRMSQLADATSRPAHRWYERHYGAAFMVARGQFEEGDQQLQEALSVGQETHMTSAFEAYTASFFTSWYAQGKAQELLPFTDLTADSPQQMSLGLNAWHLGIGLCLLDDGQTSAARERLRVVMDGVSNARRDRVRSIELAELIDLAVRLGDFDAVAFARDWLAPHSGRCCAAAGMTLLGAADVYLGLADMALGDDKGGRALVAAGVEQNRLWGLNAWVSFAERRVALVGRGL